ncbi:BREX-1 system adenine-specific DNA-methyltransferase PglX [Methanoplanus limicola]|uniref:Type IIS restriction enzyme n=1 Tax=Methanoplanus limicola DSM 2279 TaxID=937775 RepID=H1Z3P2_9EURY|nr:BREX-1 system adenine-specific DNA-methyltransferase PglX [Methanoplanus limicola]EHQ35641.1 type IIS restriction enzyme [Methanoplanus limicola DSM 2279]
MTSENKIIAESESKSRSSNPVPNFYRASAEDFRKIPGSPIAYSLSNNIRNIFCAKPPLGNIVPTRVGLMTSDNDKFMRFFWEVTLNSICFNALNKEEVFRSKKKWVPHNKGGQFRKWSGNQEYLLSYDKKSRDLLKRIGNHLPSEKLYFKPAVSWSEITSSSTAFRYYPNGFTFNIKGMCAFPDLKCTIEQILVLGNCKFTNHIIKIINPTISFGAGNFNSLPSAFIENSKIEENAQSLICYAKNDWDSYETSWDFENLPLLRAEFKCLTVEESYSRVRAHWQEMTDEMQKLEEENNRIFIEAYGLEDELTPDVPLSEITLTCNPYYRYKGDKSEEELEALLLADTMKELISYAVGCMFGRYSVDKPGLILANQGEAIKDYLEKVPVPSFMPDDDNIIPVLDDEYFTDDIVTRFKEFLKVAFGPENLSQNFDFIAGGLSGKGSLNQAHGSGSGSASSESVIRNYFIKDFYRDHLKRYKKRPIYWMFSSGKSQGFNALIYMHRYDKSTLAKMRTDYLLELESKLISERGMLSDTSAGNKKRIDKINKQIAEIKEYDELLNNRALAMIEIDLDDGVAVNYAGFEGLVQKI